MINVSSVWILIISVILIGLLALLLLQRRKLFVQKACTTDTMNQAAGALLLQQAILHDAASADIFTGVK